VINNPEKKYLKAFGKHLQKVRKEKGFSQETLGYEAELGKNQIGMIERGEINTTLSTLKKIADVMGIEPKELLDFKSMYKL
jgi:transcriptional regulator with XRE-family HTH domain